MVTGVDTVWLGGWVPACVEFGLAVGAVAESPVVLMLSLVVVLPVLSMKDEEQMSNEVDATLWEIRGGREALSTNPGGIGA